MNNYIEIPLDDVIPGMFIEFELGWLKHPFYSNSFRVESSREIIILKDCGVHNVKYFPKRSNVSHLKQTKTVPQKHIPRIQSPASTPNYTPQNKDEQLQEFLERQKRQGKLEREYKLVFSRISNIVNLLQSDTETGVKATQEFINETINTLSAEMESLVNIVNPSFSRKNVDSIHLLNVCYLGLILGKAMGLSRMQMYELGTAAFLHDIGKTRIPKKFLLKHPPYTLAEKHFLELHPKYGVEILSKVNSISRNVIEAIYQHHEKCDGTGYPQGKDSPNISLISKIISVVNIYDNLCNCYYLKRLLTPHESLSYMYTRLCDGLSKDIVRTFIKRIGVYPPGCLVELSDGNLGMVVETNQVDSTQPTVIIYDPSIPRGKPLILNLTEREGLSIVRSIRPAEAPEEVVSYLRKGDKTCLYLGTLAI